MIAVKISRVQWIYCKLCTGLGGHVLSLSNTTQFFIQRYTPDTYVYFEAEEVNDLLHCFSLFLDTTIDESNIYVDQS
jgi:hypothetical protein